jgi:hypothetical protein
MKLSKAPVEAQVFLLESDALGLQVADGWRWLLGWLHKTDRV